MWKLIAWMIVLVILAITFTVLKTLLPLIVACMVIGALIGGGLILLLR